MIDIILYGRRHTRFDTPYAEAAWQCHQQYGFTPEISDSGKEVLITATAIRHCQGAYRCRAMRYYRPSPMLLLHMPALVFIFFANTGRCGFISPGNLFARQYHDILASFAQGLMLNTSS